MTLVSLRNTRRWHREKGEYFTDLSERTNNNHKRDVFKREANRHLSCAANIRKTIVNTFFREPV